MYFSTTIAVIIIAILFLVWCLSRVLSDKTIEKDKISDFFYYFALAIKRIGEYVVVVAIADFLCNIIAKKNIYHFLIDIPNMKSQYLIIIAIVLCLYAIRQSRNAYLDFKQERYIKECGDLLRAKYILECNQNREKRQLNIVLKFAPLTIISILINNIIGALVSENVFSIINFFLKDNTNIIIITAFISYVFWIYNLHQKLSSTEKLLCSVEIRLKKQELHDSENKL